MSFCNSHSTTSRALMNCSFTIFVFQKELLKLLKSISLVSNVKSLFASALMLDLAISESREAIHSAKSSFSFFTSLISSRIIYPFLPFCDTSSAAFSCSK